MFLIVIDCPLMQVSTQTMGDEDAYDSSENESSDNGSDFDGDKEIVGKDIPDAPSESKPHVQPVGAAVPALPSPPVESPEPSSSAAPRALDLVQKADARGGDQVLQYTHPHIYI